LVTTFFESHELESSLPSSKQPTNGPLPKTCESSPHSPMTFFLMVHLDIIHPRSLLMWVFKNVQPKFCMYFLTFTCVQRVSAHPIVLYSIILVTFGKKYKSRRFSLSNFLQRHVTSSPSVHTLHAAPSS